MFESVALAAALMLSPTLVVTPVVPIPAIAPAPVAAKSDPNQTGLQPSAYKGDYFDPTMEPYRRCVAYREGRFQYWGTGANGRYESTYQMSDALVVGAAWMMTDELKATFGPEKGLEIRDTLLDTPGRKWSRYYMDMAFWTVVNWEGRASGASHWAAQKTACHPSMDKWEHP
jgi:hypothetical protein